MAVERLAEQSHQILNQRTRVSIPAYGINYKTFFTVEITKVMNNKKL